MDTETLLRSLFEFQVLLDRLHLGLNFPSSKNIDTQDYFQSISSKSWTGETPSDSVEDHPLRHLLSDLARAGQKLKDDITQAERDRQAAIQSAEEVHRRAEELDAIIMAMAEAVTIFDGNGRVTRANPAAIGLFGFDPFDLSHYDLVDILSMRHPDGSPVQVEDLPAERARRGETVLGERLLMSGTDIEECVVQVSASPLFDENGLAAVVTVWHNVTEREQLLEQIEVEQSRLRTIIHNAPEAILVADEDGRLVLSNTAAERILGRAVVTGDDLEPLLSLNLCYTDGSPYDPRNLPLVCSALYGERFSNVEMVTVLPDGQVRYILNSTAPIVDRKGNINGAVGVFQDITQHRQAEEALRQQARRSELLATLSRAFAETGLNYRELLDTVVRQICMTFGDLCSLHLLSENGEWYDPAAVYRQDDDHLYLLEEMVRGIRLSAADALVGEVFHSTQPVTLTRYPANQLGAVVPSIPTAILNRLPPDPISILIAPLRAHGRWIGGISVFRTQNDQPYMKEDLGFLQDLADRAALAIEDSRLYERAAQRARELQALHRATTVLLSTLDLEALLAQVLDAAQEAVPAAEQVVLYLLSPETSELEVRAAYDSQDLQLIQSELRAYAVLSVHEKHPIILHDMPLNDGSSSGSTVIAPLMLAHRVLGALALFGTKPGLFTENDLHLLDSFAAAATLALQNATLYSEVQRLAVTDTLTEQFNRHRFFELGEMEIRRFQRQKNNLSAIMLDLDHFAEINNTYGHAVGDQVLRVVAMRCRASIRIFDILGRYGGDEFGILLPGTDMKKACEIAERVRQNVTQTPIHTTRGDVRVSVSLGVAQAAPDEDSLSSLLGRADDALYEAKGAGRNRVETT